MQPVVPLFIDSLGLRLLHFHHAIAQFSDLAWRCIQRNATGDFRLKAISAPITSIGLVRCTMALMSAIVSMGRSPVKGTPGLGDRYRAGGRPPIIFGGLPAPVPDRGQ
jgi:hypothetical protein